MSSKKILRLHPLSAQWIDAAIALDKRTLGGLWGTQGYQQEIDREHGVCLGLSSQEHELIAMGFIWIILDEAHVISIAVEPRWQNLGLGSVILIELLNCAIDKCCNRATLEVNSTNRSALNLYRKLKFRSLGLRSNYYGKGEDAKILWLNHLQNPHTEEFLKQLCRSCTLKLAQNQIVIVKELNPEFGQAENHSAPAKGDSI